MKNIRVFLSENFQFLEMEFSIYLNRHVFVMSESLDPYQKVRFLRLEFNLFHCKNVTPFGRCFVR